MTELERKAVKQSLAYNRKYSEDRDLENVLKHPEEYVDSYAYTMNIVQMLRQKAYRDGYNVGTKENVIVWHDLRKDPNDLPKDKKFKITDKGNIGFYDSYWEKWYYWNSNEMVFPPIAWCEIPKFEVEE